MCECKPPADLTEVGCQNDCLNRCVESTDIYAKAVASAGLAERDVMLHIAVSHETAG